MPEWLDPLMKYVLIPVSGLLVILHRAQGEHSTRLAVLESEQKNINTSLIEILKKLNSIELHLRKG